MTVSATMTHDRIEQHTAFLNTLNRLDGRTAVVTGANSGLGLETACGLASLGAKIILASRSEDRNLAALALLQERVPEATTAETMQLDLASLASIERFANDLRGRLSTLDLLVNNAGVMAPPVRGETADGFEMQFGVNHLGHFALTGRLKPLLEASATGGVVVAVASLAAWKARIRFDDLQSRYRYSPFDAYRQSKLSNLLFGQELARRSRAARWNLHGRIAHPGWARTQLVVNGPGGGKKTPASWIVETGANLAFRWFGQSAACGAEPFLYASASQLAHDGCYYGPGGSGERTGKTELAIVPPSAQDPQIARRLWEVSERLTGVTFE